MRFGFFISGKPANGSAVLGLSAQRLRYETLKLLPPSAVMGV
jgi:hypothetical protein